MLAVRASSCLAVALRRRRVQAARVACSLSQCPGTHGTGNMAARGQRDKESYSDDDEQGSEIESCPDCRHEDTLCESCWQEVRPPSDYGNTDSDETTDTDTDTDTDAETSRATTMHHHYYAPAHVETHHHYYPAHLPMRRRWLLPNIFLPHRRTSLLETTIFPIICNTDLILQTHLPKKIRRKSLRQVRNKRNQL